MTQERDPIERIKKLVVLSHGLATEKELKDMEKEIRKEVDDVIAIAKGFGTEAAFSSSSLQFLPAFLESCPNLKNLVLDFSVSTESEQINLTNVPRCLTSTLEYVEIKKLIMREETWIKLANYFLENASVLKKLSVSFTDSPMANKDLDICQELLTSIKRSRICQVFIS